MKEGLIAVNPASAAKVPRATRKPIRVLTQREVLKLAWVLDRPSDFRSQGFARKVLDHLAFGREEVDEIDSWPRRSCSPTSVAT